MKAIAARFFPDGMGAPRPPTPPLLAILGFWPGWRPNFLLPPERPAPMNSTALQLIFSVLTLAARLGKALGPDAAASFFDDLFAGKIGPEAAAEKAAAALSVTLDVGILAAQLSALQGLIVAADAEAAMDKAIDFAPPTEPTPLAPPDGYMLIGAAQYAEYLSLLEAATRPVGPVPLLSPETEAGFAALEQKAQGDASGG